MSEENIIPTAINAEIVPAQIDETQTTAAPEGATPTQQFAIPEPYKEKGWAKNLKNEEDLWKMLDNTQALVGKKTVALDFAKATPKEIDDYYNQLRPADKAAYDFAEIPDDQKEVYADLLHKHGISAKQGSDLVKEYAALQKTQLEKAYDKDAFVDELKNSFGPNYEEPVKKITNALSRNLNDQDKKILDSMPNQYIGAVYRLADKIISAYGAQELGTAANAPTASTPIDKETMASQFRQEIRAMKTRPHTQAELSELTSKLTNLYRGK
jgi:hypothetical protein